MREAVASAPGKVILFGEHFVVKGSRSLVAAISLRVRVRVSPREGGRIRFHSPIAGVESWIDPATLEYGDPRLAPLARLLEHLSGLGYERVPHDVYVESSLPVGAGLGSSASLAVAYALAYTASLGDPLRGEDLVRAGYEAEVVAHGNPSGVDNTIAVYGGALVYRRGEGFRRVPLSLPRGYRLLVVDTGVPRVTRRVVEHVLGVAERAWESARHIYRAADALVDLALEAFRRGDAGMLGTLMNMNQGLLYAVGASSRVIEEIVYEARDAGAVGAKLTGAGWGGSVIVLAGADRLSRVVSRLRRLARSVHIVDLAGPGALLHEPG